MTSSLGHLSAQDALVLGLDCVDHACRTSPLQKWLSEVQIPAAEKQEFDESTSDQDWGTS